MHLCSKLFEDGFGQKPFFLQKPSEQLLLLAYHCAIELSSWREWLLGLYSVLVLAFADQHWFWLLSTDLLILYEG